MSEDIVICLREGCLYVEPLPDSDIDEGATNELMQRAADEIERLRQPEDVDTVALRIARAHAEHYGPCAVPDALSDTADPDLYRALARAAMNRGETP